ncbi:MAG TPA: VOC family protein [Verrucomicrobiae bacterium]|nr:VOC family protein [Verrucomicrobiae bacterium]
MPRPKSRSTKTAPGRVTGIGGVFFKAKDPALLGAWYRDHLGLDVQSWGGTSFPWRDTEEPKRKGSTAWCLFPATTNYFEPSAAPFMVNYRVADLDAVLAALRAEGCAVDARVEESDLGRFGWVMDPEGNRIELWQPPKGK